MTDAHDSLDQSLRRPFAAYSFLLLFHSPTIIFKSVTLSLSTRREIQFHRPLPPSPLPSFVQLISVTMGWFPERSGVDAKLSERSFFDLLLPIYKHASGKKRASVRACMLGRRGAGTCKTMRRGSGIEAEREKEKESAKPLVRHISCVGSLYVSPPPHIHYLHTLLRNTSCERAPGSHLLVSFSSFFLFLSLLVFLGSDDWLVVNIAQRGNVMRV